MFSAPRSILHEDRTHKSEILTNTHTHDFFPFTVYPEKMQSSFSNEFASIIVSCAIEPNREKKIANKTIFVFGLQQNSAANRLGIGFHLGSKYWPNVIAQ